MKLVVQRVDSASVKVDSKVVGSVGKGLLVLVGISKDCTEEKLDWVANKLINLRIWASKEKGFDLSVNDIKGEILIVSQFTLHGIIDGNKPNFRSSASFEEAKELYDLFVEKVKNSNLKVQTGEFGAMMKVESLNDGPVTLIVER